MNPLDLLVAWWQRRCPHPSKSAKVQTLMGFPISRWCGRCGALTIYPLDPRLDINIAERSPGWNLSYFRDPITVSIPSATGTSIVKPLIEWAHSRRNKPVAHGA